MKYYTLEPNLDDMGWFPQTLGPKQAHFDSKNNTRFASYSPEFTPEIVGAKLDSKAKLTDILDILHLSSYYFLTITDEVYKVLQKHKIPPHTLYKVPILESKDVHQYNLMHLQRDIHEYVDLSESIFERVSKITREKKDIQFSPHKYHSEILDLDNGRTHIFRPKEIKFKAGFDYHLFSSITIRLPLTFSEKLVNTVRQKSFTGAKFNLDQPIGFL